MIGGALLRLRGGGAGDSGKETRKESGGVEKRSSKGSKAESAARATPDAAKKGRDKTVSKGRKKERHDESEQESGASGTVVWHEEEHERGRTEEEEKEAEGKNKEADESKTRGADERKKNEADISMLAWREGAEKAVSKPVLPPALMSVLLVGTPLICRNPTTSRAHQGG